MQLPITKMEINELVPATYNPNEMSPKELNKLTRSIKEYGVVDPIIINLKDNTIIGGHHRIKALKKQKVNEVYVAKLGDVGWVFNETNLSIPDKDTEKIMNIALNNISGEMNESKLTQVLSELERNKADFQLTGFDELDLERLKLDYEILVDEKAIQNVVEDLKTPSVTPASEETDETLPEGEEMVLESEDPMLQEDGEMSEEEFYEAMDEATLRSDDDIEMLEEFPCPHCGEMVSISNAIIDKIYEKDRLD